MEELKKQLYIAFREVIIESYESGKHHYLAEENGVDYFNENFKSYE